MKLISCIVLVGLVSFSIAVAFHGASAFATTTISVASYGAKCDGMTDDTAAIQAALNAAATAGGGTVTLPGSTCLLDSFLPSSFGWDFYNIHIPSGVTLRGVANSKLLQGPNGRQLIGNVPGARDIDNCVVAVGNDFQSVHFSKNGPFYQLNGITAGNMTVKLTNPSDASNFHALDYVDMFESQNPAAGDVVPAQPVQLTAVNASTGVLTLADPVLRTFTSPTIANVTSLAAHDVTIDTVIVQGADPITVLETFNFNAINTQFLIDTSIGGSNIDLTNFNTLEHFSFINSTIAPVNGPPSTREFTQRNSQNGVISGNTFYGTAFGFGEYAGNLTFTDNHIYVYPDGVHGDEISLGGMNILFSGNDVHTIGNQTAGSGWGAIVQDMNAPTSYIPYIGNIRILNNTIQCQADGNNCLLLVGLGTMASGNTITATGSATGVYVAGSSAEVTNNTIQIGNGTGILLYTPPFDAATVASNTLFGTGKFGISVGSGRTAHTGGYKIYNNVITGFATPISVDMSLHRGTILTNNSSRAAAGRK
jgi:hypothetical protein